MQNHRHKGLSIKKLLIITPFLFAMPGVLSACGAGTDADGNPSSVLTPGVAAAGTAPLILSSATSAPSPEAPYLADAESDGFKNNLPEGFVYVTDEAPDILLEMRYYSTFNFVGTRVDGYKAPVAIMTKEAALALKNVSDELRELGYALKIYDCYRPQQAVSHFVRWGDDADDTLMKDYFYPDMDKIALFSGYISKKSGHSRGSTVDLSIVDMKTGRDVDMGSGFDLLGEISYHDTDLISPEQAANRKILKDAMVRNGFKPYSKEWWHYTLVDEPFPDTYFNFPVE